MNSRKRTGTVTKTRICGVLAMAVVGAAVYTPPLVPKAMAGDVVKASNFTTLNLNPSWGPPNAPTATDVAVFDSTLLLTSAYTFTKGADLSWQGIRLNNVSSAVTLTGANVLTLGASGAAGIDLTQNLTANGLTISQGTVTLGATQTWNSGTASGLTVSSTINTATSGYTLFLNSDRASAMTLSGPVIGNADIVKNGTGGLTLSGSMIANTGNIIINAGSVTLSGNIGSLNPAASTPHYTGTITVNGGTLASTYDRNAANNNTVVVMNGGGGVWIDSNASQKVLSMQVNGSANTYINTGAATWDNVALWSGNGTITLSVGTTATSRLTFQAATNTGALPNIVGPNSSLTQNEFTNFGGLIIMNPNIAGGINDGGFGSGLLFNTNGSNPGYWGNSVMGVDLQGTRMSNQNTGTVTLGYIMSSGTTGSNAVISATNGSTLVSLGSEYIIGNSISTTFGGRITDGPGGGGTSSNYGTVMNFVKVGSGSLTLSNTSSANSVSGIFNILQGTVEIGNASLLGTGFATINGAGTWSGVGAMNMIFGDTNSGVTTLRYIGTSASSTPRVFTTNAPAIVIDASATNSASSTISFVSHGEITPAEGLGYGTTLTLTGNNTGLNTFNPAFNNATTGGSGTTTLIKDGAGTWVLGGTYNGTIVINNGGLYINNASGGLTGAGSVLANGTIFGGTGKVAGALFINSGHLIPGVSNTNNGIGTLTLQNGLTMASNTGLDLDLGGLGNTDIVNLSNTTAVFGSNITVTTLLAGTPVPFGGIGSFSIFTNVTSLGATNLSGTTLTDLTVVSGDPLTNYIFSWASGVKTVFLVTSVKGSSWTGNANNSWGNSANWNGTAPGANAGDLGTFASGATRFTANLDGSRTMGIIGIDGGANNYTIAQGSGGTLVLDNGTVTAYNGALVLNKSGNNTISAPVQMNQDTTLTTYTGSTLTLSGVVSGLGATNMSLNGFGTVIFAGNNTYTGTTQIPSTVTVRVGIGGTDGSFGTGAVNNDGSVTLNHSNTFVLSNALSGTGSWAATGTGTTFLNPAGNFTFGTFTMANGVVDAGPVNLGGNTSLTNGVLNGNSSLVSGPLTITNSTFNTQNSLVTGGITASNSFISGGSTVSHIASLVSLTNSKLQFNGINVTGTNNATASVPVIMAGNSSVDVNGNAITLGGLTGLSSDLVTNSVSGTNVTLTLGASGLTNNFSGNITGNITLVRTGGSTYNLAGNDTWTGKTIFTGTSSGPLGIYANNSLPNTEVDVNGNELNGGVLILGDGVSLGNTIVLNYTAGNFSSGTSGIVNAAALASATYTGNISTVLGSGTSNYDNGQSAIRLEGGGTGTLTVTGNINGQATANLNGNGTAGPFSTVIQLRNGTVILDNATINSGGSEVVLGKGSSGGTASTIFLKNNASIVSNVTASPANVLSLLNEGANMGGTTNVNGAILVTLQDNAKIDIGTANFNLNGGGGTTTAGLTLNGTNTTLRIGGFTRTSAGATTLTLVGGTVIATRDNQAFMPASAGLVFQTNDGKINVGGFTLLATQALAGTGTGNFTVLGTGGSLTLAANNTYFGSTTITNAALIIGNGGSTGNLGGASIIDNGTFGVNIGTSTASVLTLFHTITGSGGLANLGGGTTNYAGTINVLGGLNMGTNNGTVVFAGGSNDSLGGSIAGTGKLEVNVPTFSSLGVQLPNASGAWLVDSNTLHTINTNGSAAGVSIVSALKLAGDVDSWEAGVDLKNNPLILLNADSVSKAANLSILQNQISFGANNTGLGITSSTATSAGYTVLALVDNNDIHLSSFRGVTGMNDNSLIVVRAHDGDTNLDGKVNSLDLTTLANNWQKPSGALWSQGDFNGDGKVNSLDLTTVANNWQFNGTPLAAALAQFPQFGGSTSVPEPASLAVLALGSAALLARRKRRVSKSERL